MEFLKMRRFKNVACEGGPGDWDEENSDSEPNSSDTGGSDDDDTLREGDGKSEYKNMGRRPKRRLQ